MTVMNTFSKRVLVVGALVVALAAGSAVLVGSEATAQSSARGGLFSVAADYIGLTREQLRAELRKGQSLAQVAAAQGKSREGLEQALLAAAEERLNAREISDERKQEIRARLPERIDKLVDKVGKPGKLRARIAKRGLLNAAADYVGLTREQLREQLRAGQSLAQIAAAQGKSVDGLKQAMLDAVKARLERKAGLSAERRERLLARAEKLIERLVNRTRG
jgi:hypothetical protein